jgi:hypothetical protein
MGIMYSEFVAVAKMPAPSFAAPALALAPAAAEEAALVEPLLIFREPRMPPTTPPAMTRTATGVPI